MILFLYCLLPSGINLFLQIIFLLPFVNILSVIILYWISRVLYINLERQNIKNLYGTTLLGLSLSLGFSFYIAHTWCALCLEGPCTNGLDINCYITSMIVPIAIIWSNTFRKFSRNTETNNWKVVEKVGFAILIVGYSLTALYSFFR